MLPDLTVPLPASLMALLAAFQPLFTAPSFRTFCALAAGFLAQTGRRTVCGMLTGAGLSRMWRHDRAHRFFSCAQWSSQALGLTLAKLVVTLLVPAGEPVLVAVDDTLFRRTGPKVHAIGWFHDGSAKGPHPHSMPAADTAMPQGSSFRPDSGRAGGLLLRGRARATWRPRARR